MMTVILATYNGAKTLAKTLNAMAAVAVPEGGWKIVVVDNGSTDGTAQIIGQFKGTLPITTCFEPRRGKNRALNSGLRFLEGDLAVFTDDDVVPQQDWLLQLRRAAADHPDFDIFGGTILPLWEAPPDPVLLEAVPLGVVYAITGAHRVAGPVPPRWIWGPNMAVRAHLFDRFRFDENIGPDGTPTYAMGSETEFTSRLADNGHKCWHCPEAVVQHIVRPHQLRRDWVLQRAIRHGRSIYRANPQHLGPLPVLFGYPRYLLRMIGRAAADLACAYAFGDACARLRARWKLNALRGQAKESRILERQKRAAKRGGSD